MQARQIKAGRAALGWSQVELARHAGIHPKSVDHWEKRDSTLPVTRPGQTRAPSLIRKAFESAGLEFEGERLWI